MASRRHGVLTFFAFLQSFFYLVGFAVFQQVHADCLRPLSTLGGLMLCGPTSCGKTALALELAHRINGGLINGDEMLYYRHLSVGIDLGSFPRSRTRLYEIFDPERPKISPPEHSAFVEQSVGELRMAGFFPIIQGTTFSYAKSVLELKNPPATLVVYREYDAKFAHDVRKRVEIEFENGFLDNVKTALTNGWDRTAYGFYGSYAYPTAAKAVRGEMSVKEAIDLISGAIVETAVRQTEKYRALPGVEWLKYDSARKDELVDAILKRIQSGVGFSKTRTKSD